jgi:hypothetical protein
VQRRRVRGLVRAEFKQRLELRRRLVGPGALIAPSIPTARLVRRMLFFLLLLAALAGAQGRPGLAAPEPDPHPSATKSREAPAPAPDPAPDTSPARTAPAQVTPDAPASTTPRSSSSNVEPRTTAQAPAPKPTPTPTPTPTRTVTAPRAKTPKSQPSSTKQEPRTTRPRGSSEAAVAPPRAAQEPDRQRVEPIVAAVADPANGRELLLGGLGVLALALASGSLLFLVVRTKGWETRT